MKEEINEETCLDSTIDFLENPPNRSSNVEHWLSTKGKMVLELRMVKMLLLGFDYWEDLSSYRHLQSAVDAILPRLSQIAEEFMDWERYDDSDDDGADVDEATARRFIKTVEEHIKPHAKDSCTIFLGGADHKCTSCQPNQKMFLKYVNETASFIDLLKLILNALLSSSLIAPVMKLQISSIQRALEKFRVVVDPTTKALFDILPHTRAWLNRVSCLLYLYWIDGNDASLASTMEAMLLHLLSEFVQSETSGVISSYFQPKMIPQSLAGHLDFLFDCWVIPMKVDSKSLHEGLIFLLSFVLDAFDENSSEDRGIIWTQVYELIDKFPSLVYSIHSGEMESFSDMLLEIGTLKEKVTKLCLVMPYSLESCPPNINALEFLDSLIGNLKKLLKMSPFLKKMWEMLFFELLSLRQLLQDGEDNEIQDPWREIMSIVYNADYVIKVRLLWSFFVWYVIVALPDVIEHLKRVKIEINNQKKKKIACPNDQMEGIVALREGTTSEIERNYISFIEVEGVVIDELTRGRDSLTIISISGSGGQGKTTFAKQIYNHPSVQYHFHKLVWCYISKNCHVEEILAQIKGDVKNGNVEKKDFQDVVQDVWRSFKGRRYLIVMDDIWDVDAWRKLKYLFPDDKNGSRIMFTSRNHELASQVEPIHSISRPLPLFSDKDSWDLMEKRVFGQENCDEELVNIGREIASYCKGLPLAVSLIAGVLGRTKPNMDSWNKVAENLKALLTLEGCGHVIELSYTYLPDHLKPCFLYFGAFQRGQNIRAKELKLLWMGEGFVSQGGEAKPTEEDLGTKYLEELVSQGLVMVAEKSSMGGIKRCNVHDLLYDLCLVKCKESNFLYCTDKSCVISTAPLKDGHHRLRIGAKDSFFQSNPLVSKRELPTSSLHSFLWMDNKSSLGMENSYSITSSVENRFSTRTYKSLQFLESFKIVTVLKLTATLYIDRFPDVVLSLLHLTHLELHLLLCCGFVPPMIANLQRLGTLIIVRPWRDAATLLPDSMLYMKCLKHVHVYHAKFGLKGGDEINLVKSNIEALSSLILDEDDDTGTEFLQCFPELRKLSCRLSGEKGNLIEWLSRVGSRLTRLESLKIMHRGWTWLPYPDPTSFNIPNIQNIRKLTLKECMFSWNYVSEIGKLLPNLRVLKLMFFYCEARGWKLEDGDFSNLIYLKMHRISNLEEIDVSSFEEDPPFPRLEHLILSRCSKLQEIPLVFGEISNLKKIHVIGCTTEVTESTKKILKDRTYFGNDDLEVTVENEEK